MHAKLDHLKQMDRLCMLDDVHDEYTILDRAGRLQLPHKILEKMGIHDNRVQL